MSKSDISFLWPLTGLSFVFATIAAIWFLNERVSGARWAGVVLIMLRPRRSSATANTPREPSASSRKQPGRRLSPERSDAIAGWVGTGHWPVSGGRLARQQPAFGARLLSSVILESGSRRQVAAENSQVGCFHPESTESFSQSNTQGSAIQQSHQHFGQRCRGELPLLLQLQQRAGPAR